MKQLAFISGALSISLTGLGILFKIMHWQGASILWVLGLGLFAILFVPSVTKYLYDKEK
jgi:uncharacterized protein involved in response to NO